MKNINQIFKNNKGLMNEPEVSELIDYCVDLEGKVLDTEIKNSYDKEHILKSSLFDILNGCREFIFSGHICFKSLGIGKSVLILQ